MSLRLFERLQRNDPTVTKVKTRPRRAPYGYGQRLGAALLNNTVVMEVQLHVVCLLSAKEMYAGRTDGASYLLQYLKHSPSLRSVILADWKGKGSVFFCPTAISLTEFMLNAAFQNASIQSLDVDIPDFPLLQLNTALTVS
jgi:hypothetical protein